MSTKSTPTTPEEVQQIMYNPDLARTKDFRSFAFHTKMWNALPTAIKTCKSLNSFKTALKSHHGWLNFKTGLSNEPRPLPHTRTPLLKTRQACCGMTNSYLHSVILLWCSNPNQPYAEHKTNPLSEQYQTGRSGMTTHICIHPPCSGVGTRNRFHVSASPFHLPCNDFLFCYFDFICCCCFTWRVYLYVSICFDELNKVGPIVNKCNALWVIHS